MFNKILIANRGEIALRIIRTCQEMGIETVAIHSTSDESAMHVRLANQSVCIGPPSPIKSYLNIPAIISAAEITGAEAIHPGYGFLSENYNFAAITKEHGIEFIGPESEHIRMMGNKVEAKKTAKDLGLPILPGSEGKVGGTAQIEKIVGEIGFPIIIKAASGGGGRGMKVVNEGDDLHSIISIAAREAKSFFGDESLYIEKFLPKPRHIEIQILSDGKDNSLFFGERDCSIQRRHQKVIEETPAMGISRDKINELGEKSSKAMKKLGYKGVGTIEYLYENGKFYFIEMNTRIQVEHTITEETYGVDLIREQILIAMGQKLNKKQSNVLQSGHSIQCRILAEDPKTFIPCAGLVENYHPPGGHGIRIDSALYNNYFIPPNYDSLISKLIVSASNRNDCLNILNRALEEYVISGIKTNIPLLIDIINRKEFINGDYDINWLEKNLNG
ncbi:MAG: Biotin carboxylase [Alphaproteobacteria bacterium MarineAlpha2_Bin1]|nr:MAG: Biotin carboxylase [Alphaproteobacteria bacterium MarineAlpha2_Bin1]